MSATRHHYLDLPALGAELHPDSPHSIYRRFDAAALALEQAAERQPVETLLWAIESISRGMRAGMAARRRADLRREFTAALRPHLPETAVKLILAGYEADQAAMAEAPTHLRAEARGSVSGGST